MNKRLLAMAVSIAGLLATGCTAAPPNMIFILTDDLGWGDLSCYGQQNWQTPRLDEMALEGMLFTDAYAGNTVCAPSRATLLTGQHTGHVYQRGNGSIAFRRDPEDITIATRLRDAGYRTAMIGKSGVACNSNDADLPNDKGFDHFYGLLSHSAAHRNYPEEVVRNGETIQLTGNSGHLGDTYANGLWVDDALTWIEDNKEGPFFLHLSITPPHADLTIPERYMTPFRGRFEESANTTGGYYHQQETRAAYAGMIAFIDESVGRVLDKLEELGIDENTLVVFASDNGPHSEGGGDPDYFDSNGPFRGGKRDMYDGGIRSPQLAWWPGTINAGSRTDHITAFWDFPATALDLAGEPIPDHFDGISYAPLLKGQPQDQQQHDYLYWEFYEQGGKQAVRMGPWKGIRLNVADDRAAPIELYHIERDAGEQRDVSQRYPTIRSRIVQIMDDAHTPSDVFRFERRRRSNSKPAGRRRISNENDALVLDRAAFRVISTDSASTHNGKVGSNVIDESITSWWHTQWREASPPHPHEIVIDLGKRHDVSGIRIMARQDNTDNGIIKDLEIYLSASRSGNPRLAQSTRLSFTKNEQEVMFDQIATGRYLTLRSISAFDGSPYACIANLEVLGEAAR